ncbi:hypothetical protein CUZ56_00253 [Saezia sanguinis]|uniref:Uncharacterized protein n=1 Tax=Saezia sanguinis TaxID=1965230 RepID=A0A433SGG2_9BURK|nr:hypothetical protein [Saezia sanguinis]RUS67776.1 hypothetical protein CUZ56_00253 [Saezia sanguinis]
MNNDESSQTNISKFTGVFGLIEKLWDITWSLRVFIIVLYVDIVLMLHNRVGLMGWEETKLFFTQNPGYAIAWFSVLGLFVSILIPSIEFVFRRVCEKLFWNHIYGFHRGERRSGEALYSDVLEFATRSGDKVLLDSCKDHERNSELLAHKGSQIAWLTVATAILVAADIGIPFINYSDQSILYHFGQMVGWWGGGVVLLFYIGCWYVLCFAWQLMDSNPWILYPPMADEIVAKEKKQKHLQDELIQPPLRKYRIHQTDGKR